MTAAPNMLEFAGQLNHPVVYNGPKQDTRRIGARKPRARASALSPCATATVLITEIHPMTIRRPVNEKAPRSFGGTRLNQLFSRSLTRRRKAVRTQFAGGMSRRAAFADTARDANFGWFALCGVQWPYSRHPASRCAGRSAQFL